MIETSVIGLGAMGAGIAGNLQRAGMLAAAWNRTREKGETIAAQHGFELASSMQEAAARADLVITSVSADNDLLAVVDELGPAMQAGSVVLDTSTTSVQAAEEAAARLQRYGVEFLDGPVSGGKEGAEKGTMVMMVGGDEDVLNRVMPALEVISSKVTYMGAVGKGQATKAVNQIMVAGINQGVSEALAFAQSQQLDIEKLVDTLSGGAGGSWFLAHRGKSMSNDVFEPGFKVALHNKDLKICQAMLEKLGVKLSVVEATREHYEHLIEQGYGDEDISALFRAKCALFED